MDKLQRIWTYIKGQLAQPSTWRGLTILMTVAGMQLTPDEKELILYAGLSVAGLIGTVFPDPK